MPVCCKQEMTALQRRSFRLVSAAMLFEIFTNFLTPKSAHSFLYAVPVISELAVVPGHTAVWKVIVVAALQLLPVLVAVAVAAHYLANEPDEFIRSVVTRALLWGIACTMVAGSLAGVIMMATNRPFPVGMINADVFFLATLISFRVVQWRYSR